MMAKTKVRQNKADEPHAEASQESLEDMTEGALSEAQDPAGPAVGSREGATNSELQEARAEIARLRQELAAKDKEIVSLRQQLDARNSAPKFDQSKLQDVAKLQERLSVLRKEQAEADTARDTAWKQLKAVVQDISKLASPDYLQSINIPSQS